MPMTDNGLGFSFEPGQSGIPVGGQTRAPGGPQSAVQVKSFTLPNRSVPGQIAPQALLQSPGGGGQMDLTLLRQLMAAFAPQGQQPGVPSLGGMPQGMPGGMSQGMSQGMVGGQPGSSPFAGGRPAPQGPPMTGGAPPPPRVIPGDTPDPTDMIFLPEPPPQPQAPPLFDIGNPSPPGFGAGGTLKQPYPGKFDWQNIQGLFD